MAFSVPATFFNDFKIYQNVKYNLNVLEELYSVYNQEDYHRKLFLRKPITVTEVSIIEALLYDFLARVRKNTSEGVQGLDEEILCKIRASNYNLHQLGALITLAEESDLFDESDSKFYFRLKELSHLRNRLHIQNIWKNQPLVEREAFTARRLLSAERCLEKVATTLSAKHPRPEYIRAYLITDLHFPWDRHLS
jgi:hypothetical protein